MFSKKPFNIKRSQPSKRPRIKEKRNVDSNFAGMNLEQAKELASLLEARDSRIGIQRKKSAIAKNSTKKIKFKEI